MRLEEKKRQKNTLEMVRSTIPPITYTFVGSMDSKTESPSGVM